MIIEDDISQYIREILEENDECCFGHYYPSPLIGTSVGVKGVALHAVQAMTSGATIYYKSKDEIPHNESIHITQLIPRTVTKPLIKIHHPQSAAEELYIR